MQVQWKDFCKQRQMGAMEKLMAADAGDDELGKNKEGRAHLGHTMILNDVGKHLSRGLGRGKILCAHSGLTRELPHLAS